MLTETISGRLGLCTQTQGQQQPAGTEAVDLLGDRAEARAWD